jgi:2-polyprenyl-6-methoxyphenol hydroxylase-like FAD-dependent oxidoreductase
VFAGPDGFEFYEDDVVQPRVPRSRLLLGTRPFHEALLRRHTLALPKVQVVTGQATGLVYEGDAVRGVRYTDGVGERTVRSDFVVEATGRSSRLSDWLAGQLVAPRARADEGGHQLCLGALRAQSGIH